MNESMGGLDHLRSQHRCLEKDQGTLQHQLTELLCEREEASATLDAAIGERDAAIGERDAATAERDTAIAELNVAIGEQDAAAAALAKMADSCNTAERESRVAEGKAGP